MQERIKDIIIRLKNIRDREGLSNAQIIRMVDELNCDISEATIRRVLEDGSEERTNFRPESIEPLEKVILKIDKDHLEGESDEVRALKDIIMLREMEIKEKDLQIQHLTATLKSMEDEGAKRTNYLKERVEYLKDQIAQKDALLQKRDDMLEKLSDSLIEMISQNKKE